MASPDTTGAGRFGPRKSSASREPREAGAAADVAFGAGLLYVAALFGAGNLFSGYATGVALGELPEPVNVDIARVLTGQGFGLLLLYHRGGESRSARFEWSRDPSSVPESTASAVERSGRFRRPGTFQTQKSVGAWTCH